MSIAHTHNSDYWFFSSTFVWPGNSPENLDPLSCTPPDTIQAPNYQLNSIPNFYYFQQAAKANEKIQGAKNALTRSRENNLNLKNP